MQQCLFLQSRTQFCISSLRWVSCVWRRKIMNLWVRTDSKAWNVSCRSTALGRQRVAQNARTNQRMSTLASNCVGKRKNCNNLKTNFSHTLENWKDIKHSVSSCAAVLPQLLHVSQSLIVTSRRIFAISSADFWLILIWAA